MHRHIGRRELPPSRRRPILPDVEPLSDRYQAKFVPQVLEETGYNYSIFGEI
jgi:hypothetical protein